MTLQYLNGHTIEAVLLSRTDLVMRVVPRGFEDVVELNFVNGAWVSDDCEPVQVRFAWESPVAAPVSEEDFICPPELAARLISMLYMTEEPEAEPAPMTLAAGAAGRHPAPSS